MVFPCTCSIFSTVCRTIRLIGTVKDGGACSIRVTVVIPVAQLDCGNGTMNEHMRKALKADANPSITFTLDSYALNGSAATLQGTLEMSGQKKPVEIPATISEEGNLIHVKASKPINMKEWGVKPPSLMLGTMKVKENVTVGFDVAVKR